MLQLGTKLDFNLFFTSLANHQELLHTHCVLINLATNKWVMVCDLGLSTVFVFVFNDKTGELTGNVDDDRHISDKADAGYRHCFWDMCDMNDTNDPTALFLNNKLDGTITATNFNPTWGKLVKL